MLCRITGNILPDIGKMRKNGHGPDGVSLVVVERG
jgi:hypothetical protein